MRRIAKIPLVLAVLLAACARTSQGSANQIETEVARQLTAQVLPNTQVALTAAVITPTLNPADLPSVTPTETPITPTVTLTPTDTLTPTITITPTFTPPADDPVLTLGGASWRDDFLLPNYLWPWSGSDYSFAYGDHQFVITGHQSGKSDSWIFGIDQLENFYLEMTAAVGTCSGLDRFGFVFGVPYPDDYPSFLFRVSCSGMYSFGYYGDVSVDYKFHVLRDWTASPHILAGSNQTNRIGVMVQGTKARLYANGHFLAEIVEPTLGKGRFGVFAASAKTAGYEVRISDIAYWLLD